YSNYGTGLDIVAPGGDTTVDRNGDGYADGILQQTFGDLNYDGFPDNYTDFYHVFYQGTSMATPHVAGAAALLLADGLPAASVQSRLTGTAQTDMSGYTSSEYGAGMLDAAAMFNPSSDVTPPQPVTGLSTIAGDEQVALSWTNPSGSDFAGVRVYRKTGSVPSSAGDGTLVYDGSGSSTTNTGLSNNTTYYYGVFSHDSVDNYAVGVSASARPAASTDTTAPSNPDDFSASALSETSVRLTWAEASESDFAGTMVRRSTVDFPSSSTEGELVYDGTGESVTDTGLISGSTYYYTAFSYDNSGNVSTGLSAVETPGSTDSSGPTAVTSVSASSTASSVTLSWTNPFNADFSHVLITRKVGTAAPSSPTDGVVVYTDSTGTFTDMGVTGGTTYTYALYAYDTSGNRSSGASISSAVGTVSIVTAPGQGGGPHVRAFDATGTPEAETNFFAYAESFRGGVRVAAGDIDADGQDEIVVGAGKGGGPQIRVFEKDGTVKPIQFFAFHPDFRGGIDVATGDVDGDGKAEVAACQFSEGQAWVKVYRYNAEQTVLSEFNAFGSPEVGCTVAMGDIDADGADEIVVGAGAGGGPQVRVFETDGSPKPIQFFAFHPDSRSGIDVAVGDVTGDGKAEVFASQLQGEQAWVKTYRYNTEKSVLGEWNAYGAPEVGTSIDVGDLDNDGAVEVVTGPGPGGGPHVRAFESDGTAMGGVSFFPYDSAFRGGVNIATGSF
ncbi:MAG: VCBS repeat-containing protein, partial [Candidatus Andersenbacteria bacterium]|nr:VCBS repeat-containing protein [Candidatus Andersenbacteria bacterium]